MQRAMLASALFGGVAVNGLNAQSKPPGAYAIVDISEMTEANLFREQLLPKVTPATVAAFGGQYLVRSENAVAIDGTPPRRFVVIAFDSMDKAKAWSTSPGQKEVDAIRMKATKSRQFLVEAARNRIP
jgi:uncharacterized protein (DUF1330 family)